MRPSSLLPRLAEAVVLNFVKIVDCHVMIPLIDRASRRDFNGGVVEISVIFRHDGPFLALQMVKLINYPLYTSKEGLTRQCTSCI